MERFAGFEVADEVLGLEFVRLPGSGCEARSILWTNQVDIGLQGPTFRNFHFNAFAGIHLIFKGIQDFEGSAIYVIIDSARTDRSLYGGHARVNPAFEQKFGESFGPSFGRSPYLTGDRFHDFGDFKCPVGKDRRHDSSFISYFAS